ncbi:MAG: hypothetical protein JST53_15445 [Actinobacteria bacterium]|nr:hypothetical protein [Actinomycetota bacterium]
MRVPRKALGIFCLLSCGVALLAGCGGGSDSGSQVNKEAEAGKTRPAPPVGNFPATEGRTLKTFLEDEADVLPTGKVVPSAEAFYPGANRYPFLVTQKDTESGRPGKEISDAEVAIYFAKRPSGSKAKGQAFKQLAVGPFPARIESLATEKPFQGKTTTENPDVANVVYSADLRFPGPGEYRPVALIKERGGWAKLGLRSIKVGEFAKIPRPGDKAPSIQTPTAQDVEDLAELSTRVPPDTQNMVNYADVLGKEPILLLFTTPQFCQSRVCGPVVDVAQQAQQQFKGKANFIHMEIYNDNDPANGVRPQVRKFHLPTEPWLFAINREGVVSATIEGGFGTELMDKTVEKVIAE